MTYALNTTPSFGTLSDGMVLTVRFPAASQGGDTLNLNSTGAYPVVKENSTGIDVPITSSDIIANQLSLICWNAQNSTWILLTGLTSNP